MTRIAEFLMLIIVAVMAYIAGETHDSNRLAALADERIAKNGIAYNRQLEVYRKDYNTAIAASDVRCRAALESDAVRCRATIKAQMDSDRAVSVEMMKRLTPQKVGK